MSRAGAIGKTLQLPSGCTIRVEATVPSGDCFYDCMDLLLPAERALVLATPQAMRDHVASTLTTESMELYRMYAMAGVEDFAWMNHHHAPTNLDELRDFARRSGKEWGAGQCLWADEHALEVVAARAGVTILIIDEQATSCRGGRSGKRRADDDGRPDGRFVLVGAAAERTDCVIIHRSRRQHFSAVMLQDQGTLPIAELPVATRALWPSLALAQAEGRGEVAAAAAASAALGITHQTQPEAGHGNSAREEASTAGAASAENSSGPTEKQAPADTNGTW